LAYQAFTVFGQPFQTVLLAQQFSVTLCRLVIAPASKTEIWIAPGLRHGRLQCHNPLMAFVYQLIYLNFGTLQNKFCRDS